MTKTLPKVPRGDTGQTIVKKRLQTTINTKGRWMQEKTKVIIKERGNALFKISNY